MAKKFSFLLLLTANVVLSVNAQIAIGGGAGVTNFITLTKDAKYYGLTTPGIALDIHAKANLSPRISFISGISTSFMSSYSVISSFDRHWLDSSTGRMRIEPNVARLPVKAEVKFYSVPFIGQYKISRDDVVGLSVFGGPNFSYTSIKYNYITRDAELRSRLVDKESPRKFPDVGFIVGLSAEYRKEKHELFIRTSFSASDQTMVLHYPEKYWIPPHITTLFGVRYIFKDKEWLIDSAKLKRREVRKQERRAQYPYTHSVGVYMEGGFDDGSNVGEFGIGYQYRSFRPISFLPRIQFSHAGYSDIDGVSKKGYLLTATGFLNLQLDIAHIRIGCKPSVIFEEEEDPVFGAGASVGFGATLGHLELNLELGAKDYFGFYYFSTQLGITVSFRSRNKII